MSENTLILIPVDERTVPDAQAVEQAAAVLANWVSHSAEIAVEAPDSITFYDSGGNFEAVHCPRCGSQLSMHWWQAAMGEAFD